MRVALKILTERGKWVAGTLGSDAAKQLNAEPDCGSTKSATAELYEKAYHFIITSSWWTWLVMPSWLARSTGGGGSIEDQEQGEALCGWHNWNTEESSARFKEGHIA